MPVSWIASCVIALAVVGYVIGRMRAVSQAGGDTRRLHSRTNYYGWNVALFTAIPALVLVLVWQFVQPPLVLQSVMDKVPPAESAQIKNESLFVSDVLRTAHSLERAVQRKVLTADEAAGLTLENKDRLDRLGKAQLPLATSVNATALTAAQDYVATSRMGHNVLGVAALVLALGGFAFAYLRINPAFRARNVVETFVKGMLIASASIAIFTTLGIVLSMLFESGNFFRQYPWQDFFFGTTWSPKFGGGSQLGILPLVWGTLYISFIALAVSVPIGLFAAIYMSEYASPRLRSVAKPMIEILAGIPTIVYGLFALITVGPMLRDYFAQPLGLGSSGSSVMTAGLVMGIMLIPFVSSLSDDIINAVPQSLRDGALGLGSTPSETVRKVVLPAALPGIVGAILLAASRAIGETMIVVMGAGAAAKLDLNPFEAMTTITVKIVSQLTGDTDFAAPETLVAFALGLTLFVVTLGLNIIALYVVRKYREQYE